MKLHYYLMGAAMMAAASVSFTACNDDDNDEPVFIVGDGDTTEVPDIELSTDTVRVKIGADTRVAIPVASETGGIKGFSLDPSTADVVDVDGVPMIEGFKNGICTVMVSDANNTYKKLIVSVYTTDQMQLSQSEFTFFAPLGGSGSSSDVYVLLGNGGYSIESDNPEVEASITPETGVITITATSKVDPYTATLTVTDISGLTADLKVTVEASLDPFTAQQLQEILELDESTIWADCINPSAGNTPSYWAWRNYGYGKFINETNGSTRSLGWWCIYWDNDLGGIKIDYPANASVGAEVEGTLYYQYSNLDYNPCYQYEGKAKVLADDATKTVVICWQVDLENQRINRGYVVMMK